MDMSEKVAPSSSPSVNDFLFDLRTLAWHHAMSWLFRCESQPFFTTSILFLRMLDSAHFRRRVCDVQVHLKEHSLQQLLACVFRIGSDRSHSRRHTFGGLARESLIIAYVNNPCYYRIKSHKINMCFDAMQHFCGLSGFFDSCFEPALVFSIEHHCFVIVGTKQGIILSQTIPRFQLQLLAQW